MSLLATLRFDQLPQPANRQLRLTVHVSFMRTTTRINRSGFVGGMPKLPPMKDQPRNFGHPPFVFIPGRTSMNGTGGVGKSNLPLHFLRLSQRRE
jgi:hypothetical protein